MWESKAEAHSLGPLPLIPPAARTINDDILRKTERDVVCCLSVDANVLAYVTPRPAIH